MVLHEDIIAVLNEELDGLVLHLRVCHLAGKRFWTHYCRSKDDGDIEWCHLSKKVSQVDQKQIYMR